MLVWVVVSNIFEKIHPETWGFMIQFDEHILQMGCFNHQLVVFWRVYVWSIQSELASVSISSTAVVEEWFFFTEIASCEQLLVNKQSFICQPILI